MLKHIFVMTNVISKKGIGANVTVPVSKSTFNRGVVVAVVAAAVVVAAAPRHSQ
jgi:5-enolpyruvylshikimate-3-phosphate synthase